MTAILCTEPTNGDMRCWTTVDGLELVRAFREAADEWRVTLIQPAESVRVVSVTCHDGDLDRLAGMHCRGALAVRAAE